MFTRFASVEDFLRAVTTERRPLHELRHDETLRYWVDDYRLWLTDGTGKPCYLDDVRGQLDRHADLFRPGLPPSKPKRIMWKGNNPWKPTLTDGWRHMFELFGIDWTNGPRTYERLADKAEAV